MKKEIESYLSTKYKKNFDSIEEIKTFRVYLKDMPEDWDKASERYENIMHNLSKKFNKSSILDIRECRDEDEMEYFDVTIKKK